MQFTFVATLAFCASIVMAYDPRALHLVPQHLDIVRRGPQTPGRLLYSLIDTHRLTLALAVSEPSMKDANGNLVAYDPAGVDTTYKSAGNSASRK